MTQTPTPAAWFPEDRLNGVTVITLALTLQNVARELGYSRETYAAAVAQMAEAIVGHSSEDDIDGEVLRFLADRLQATVDAINGSAN